MLAATFRQLVIPDGDGILLGETLIWTLQQDRPRVVYCIRSLCLTAHARQRPPTGQTGLPDGSSWMTSRDHGPSARRGTRSGIPPITNLCSSTVREPGAEEFEYQCRLAGTSNYVSGFAHTANTIGRSTVRDGVALYAERAGPGTTNPYLKWKYVEDRYPHQTVIR